MNEIRLCARLEHPKIVKFIGISWSTLHDLAVLSEFMPRGTMKFDIYIYISIDIS